MICRTKTNIIQNKILIKLRPRILTSGYFSGPLHPTKWFTWIPFHALTIQCFRLKKTTEVYLFVINFNWSVFVSCIFAKISDVIFLFSLKHISHFNIFFRFIHFRGVIKFLSRMYSFVCLNSVIVEQNHLSNLIKWYTSTTTYLTIFKIAQGDQINSSQKKINVIF